MRGIHASLLVLQGVPIFIGIFLVCWVAYYIRAAVIELRAVNRNLERLNYYFENPEEQHEPQTASSAESGAARETTQTR
jgi:hypothetical protein